MSYLRYISHQLEKVLEIEIKKMFRADFLNEQFDIGIGDSTCIKEKLVLNASLPIHLLPCILEWPLL